ncbi:hypothetical protein [Saccharicrinis aurantiacus]|uniref:hypothetical protein n=1 Tax=Saccharicrinis aurantiacus TaxID=1849719 RepID=UPI002492087B|nr:hypothetical protein [Saccharicrinis aurantiacus]
MLTDQEKYEALNEILNSKLFSKSTTANVLLKFLVDSSVNNVELSASAIGLELFGSQYPRDKGEANARVNIYHLRKKLQKYYDTEGADNDITISIETGQYGVTFTNVPTRKKKRSYTLAIVIAITALTMGIFFSSINWNQDLIWHSTFCNNKPTTLFISPVFGYNGPSIRGTNVFHRDAQINSEKELQSILDTIPDGHLYKMSRPNYTTYEDAATIKHFARLFAFNDADFSVRKATDFTFSDLKEQNIIYLSPMRYRTTFSDVFNELSKNVKLQKKFSNNNQRLVYDKAKTDSVFLLNTDTQNFEYALAAKFKGSNNTNHLMFFADHGMGLSAMSEYFANKDSINSFSEKYLKESEEFVALFYVGGKQRTNLKLDMVFIDDNQ